MVLFVPIPSKWLANEEIVKVRRQYADNILDRRQWDNKSQIFEEYVFKLISWTKGQS